MGEPPIGRCALLVAVSMNALACGRARSSPPPTWQPPVVDLADQSAVGGSRLRPLVWQADGQPSVATARLYDSERDEECSFAADDAGTLRCFPTAVATEDWSDTYRMYADASCRDEVYTPDTSFPPITGIPSVEPRYVAATHESGCASGTRLYELGEELTTLPYYGPDCVGQIQGVGHVFRRGRRIPNDAFVRAASAPSERSAGRLAETQLTAEDGTAEIQGLYDLASDAGCEAWELAEGLRCLPSPVAVQTQWPGTLELDGEACWDLVVATAPCAPPRTGIVFDVTAQGGEVHALIPAAQVKSPSDAQRDCLAVAKQDLPGDLWVFGDEIDADTFASVTRGTITGSRLSASWLEDPSATLVVPNAEDDAGFQDLELQARCWLRTAADGAVRCLPGLVADYFADAGCATPLAEMASDTAPFVRLQSSGVSRVFPRGAAFAGDVYRNVTGDPDDIDCEVVALPPALASVGSELPPVRFVRYDLGEIAPAN